MTKSEFIKLEKENGFEKAVEILAKNIDIGNPKFEFRFIMDYSSIFNEVYSLIENRYYGLASDYLRTFEEEREKIVDWWIYDIEEPPLPIKTIDDVEEFLDDEGGAKNE